MGIGDWGLGIGDWGLGPIPNPQSPIPNPQSPYFLRKNSLKFNIKYISKKYKMYTYIKIILKAIPT